MADEVTVCNQALGWLGANLITSFTDRSTEAALCKANYDELRDAVLEEGMWSFARDYYVFDQAATVGDKHDWKYEYSYNVPDGILLVLRVHRLNDINVEVDWELVDGKLYTDCEEVQAEVVMQVSNVNKFTRTFRQALAYRIAAELAIPLTHDKVLADYYENKFQSRLESALAVDGQQGRNERYRSGPLIAAHGGPRRGSVVGHR